MMDTQPNTLKMGKSELVARASEQMRQHLDATDLTTRRRVALTCRILFAEGHTSGLAGQITARAEYPDQYYTQQLGLGFDEISESNLLVVDEHLNVQQGDGMANPANRFHIWIYRARPDVQCIVHTHPPPIFAHCQCLVVP